MYKLWEEWVQKYDEKQIRTTDGNGKMKNDH